jgi:hypothetical protein
MEPPEDIKRIIAWWWHRHGALVYGLRIARRNSKNVPGRVIHSASMSSVNNALPVQMYFDPPQARSARTGNG